MLEKIKSCKTMKELDALRIEVIKDRKNYEVNALAFIIRKCQLRRDRQ